MSQRKFAHNARVDYSRERLRVQCSCGKQSPIYTADGIGEQEARTWSLNHTGLKEVQPGRK